MVYLHDHRIVQGDLKSHNILLRKGTHQAIICDFGIARFLDNDNQEKKRANTAKGKSIESYCLCLFLKV
jgi:serine/threonine protein kinase